MKFNFLMILSISSIILFNSLYFFSGLNSFKTIFINPNFLIIFSFFVFCSFFPKNSSNLFLLNNPFSKSFNISINVSSKE